MEIFLERRMIVRAVVWLLHTKFANVQKKDSPSILFFLSFWHKCQSNCVEKENQPNANEVGCSSAERIFQFNLFLFFVHKNNFSYKLTMRSSNQMVIFQILISSWRNFSINKRSPKSKVLWNVSIGARFNSSEILSKGKKRNI